MCDLCTQCGGGAIADRGEKALIWCSGSIDRAIGAIPALRWVGGRASAMGLDLYRWLRTTGYRPHPSEVAEALKVMRIPEEYWDACFLAAGVPAVKE